MASSPATLLSTAGFYSLAAFFEIAGYSAHAGRAFAAYGGVYICASLLWLWIVEGIRPDRWDTTGAVVSLLGAAVIIWCPRP